jgi:hypothetical protein
MKVKILTTLARIVRIKARQAGRFPGLKTKQHGLAQGHVV